MPPFLSLFRDHFPSKESIYKLIRYGISGVSAAAVNISILYALVQYGGLHYLTASISAVLSSMVFGFVLQKYWTFNNKSSHALHAQAAGYLVVGMLNLVINTSLMYLFVTILGIWYVAGQVLAGIAIAITGYIAYHQFVFTSASDQQ